MSILESFEQFVLDRLGLAAYPDSLVPDGTMRSKPSYPYVTYDLPCASLFGQSAARMDLWFRTASKTTAATKLTSVINAVPEGGLFYNFTGGAMWIKRGSPFAQLTQDTSDELVHRIFTNLTVEFIYDE